MLITGAQHSYILNRIRLNSIYRVCKSQQHREFLQRSRCDHVFLFHIAIKITNPAIHAEDCLVNPNLNLSQCSILNSFNTLSKYC